MSQDQLALFGGQKTIQKKIREKWKRPIAMEKSLINRLIDEGIYCDPGRGGTKTFEEEFAAYIGCKYCLSFSHGTDALMSAYYAAGVGPGDEVIAPAIGYICSYSGAIHLGARPILADIDPKTLLIDPKEIEKKISKRTKAINIVHLNGRVCKMDEILDICRRYDLPLIDDASHAHGACWNGKKIGNFDHLTCYSLQGTTPFGKPVSGGEGGVVCTNNQSYYHRLLAYSQLHRVNLSEKLKGSPYEDFDREVLGLKWRPHALGIALAYISLKSLDERNQKRAENYLRVCEVLKEFNFISMPESNEKAEWGGFWSGNFFVYHEEKMKNLSVQQFIDCLKAEGVPVRGPGFDYVEARHKILSEGFDLWGEGRGPLQGAWQGLESYQPCQEEDYPHAFKLNQCVFKIPSFIEVDEEFYAGLKLALEKIQHHYQ